MKWDLSVKLYHWLQLVCLVVLFASGKAGQMTVHLYAGLFLTFLLVYRLIWAVTGPYSARVTSFITSPKAVVIDLLNTIKKRAHDWHSHSPAGGYMVLALWLLLLSQIITGLFGMDDFLFSGPLANYVSFETSEYLTDIHALLVNLLLGLVALHVLAVFWVQHGLKEKLIQKMWFTKSVDKQIQVSRLNQSVAVVIALVISVVLYWLWHQNAF